MLTAPKNKQYQVKMESIAYKSSLQFKDLLDAYIKSLEKEGILFEDIMFRDRILISKKDIHRYFYEIERSTSIANSLTIVSERLLREIQKYQSEMFDEDWVMEEIEALDDEEFLEAYTHVQNLEDEEEFYDSGMEEEFLRGKIIERAFTPLIEEIKSFNFINIFATYRRMFTDWSPQNPPKFWNEIRQQTIEEFDHMFLSWENATPYIYFKERLLGENTDRSVKY